MDRLGANRRFRWDLCGEVECCAARVVARCVDGGLHVVGRCCHVAR